MAAAIYGASMGPVVPAELAGLDWAEWLEHFEGEGYPWSVVLAADEGGACLLPLSSLRRLLREHGEQVADLADDLRLAEEAGHAVLPLCHAGQALCWLGY